MDVWLFRTRRTLGIWLSYDQLWIAIVNYPYLLKNVSPSAITLVDHTPLSGPGLLNTNAKEVSRFAVLNDNIGSSYRRLTLIAAGVGWKIQIKLRVTRRNGHSSRILVVATRGGVSRESLVESVQSNARSDFRTRFVRSFISFFFFYYYFLFVSHCDAVRPSCV